MEQTILSYLSESELFHGLNEEELEIAEEHMFSNQLEPGEYLFKEGDNGDFFCFVIDGTLEVIKHGNGGKDVTLAKLRRGQSIGEMAIIDSMPRSASVRAVDEAALLVLTRKGFDRLIENYPKIGVIILKSISKLLSMNIRRTSKEFAELVQSQT